MNDAARRFDDARRNTEAAEALIDNPVLRLCLDAIREEALREIEETSPDEAKEREQAYHLLRALRRLDAKINAAAADMAVTARNLRSRLAD